MAVTKEQRLQIRVDPERKLMLERAASASDQNLSAFVLLAASQRAESVLAERQVIDLSPDAAKAFSEGVCPGFG